MLAAANIVPLAQVTAIAVVPLFGRARWRGWQQLRSGR
jgi:hypothetical protein